MLRAEVAVALRDVALDAAVEVAAGTCVAVTGRSGAGKTTLLRIVSGLLTPNRGTVECAGETWLDTARRIDVAPERRRAALLHQDDALFPHLSAARNVAYGLRAVPRAERRDRAHALLATFGVGHLADARPRHLSGGERRRVALARALAADPPVLLLDEPFTGLDEATREDVRAAVRTALDASGVPAVLVTHDAADARALDATVHVLSGGILRPAATDPSRDREEPAA